MNFATLLFMSRALSQAIATSCLAFAGGILIILLARGQKLSFRYTAGWLLLLSVSALSGVLIPITEPLARSLGTTPGVLVSGMAIIILVLICIQLSVSISGLQKQLQTLAEEIAIQNHEKAENTLAQDSK